MWISAMDITIVKIFAKIRRFIRTANKFTQFNTFGVLSAGVHDQLTVNTPKGPVVFAR